jgi:hypothetical protein
MQLGLFATGHMMISVYGHRAGNSAYEIGLTLFTGAILGILGVMASRLGKAS